MKYMPVYRIKIIIFKHITKHAPSLNVTDKQITIRLVGMLLLAVEAQATGARHTLTLQNSRAPCANKKGAGGGIVSCPKWAGTNSFLTDGYDLLMGPKFLSGSRECHNHHRGGTMGDP